MPTAQGGWIELDRPGHRVRWWSHGEGPETLLVLHGGPGASHAYLAPLAALAADDLRVVFFDQLGAGESARPGDPGLWTLARAVAEVEQVRAALGLGAVHLRAVLRRLPGARARARPSRRGAQPRALEHRGERGGGGAPHERLCGPRCRPATTRRCCATRPRARSRTRATGPWSAASTPATCAAATPTTPPVSAAEFEDEIAPLLADLGPAYAAMWGPNEFLPTGSLLGWDVTDRLGEIAVPTLILCGLHDDLGVPLHAAMAERIPGNEFVVFGNSSHLPFRERDRGAYLDVVRGFLARARGAAAG